MSSYTSTSREPKPSSALAPVRTSWTVGTSTAAPATTWPAAARSSPTSTAMFVAQSGSVTHPSWRWLHRVRGQDQRAPGTAWRLLHSGAAQLDHQSRVVERGRIKGGDRQGHPSDLGSARLAFCQSLHGPNRLYVRHVEVAQPLYLAACEDDEAWACGVDTGGSTISTSRRCTSWARRPWHTGCR